MSSQQLVMARRANAHPYIEAVGGGALAGEVFTLQFDNTGAPLPYYTTSSGKYDLYHHQENSVNQWYLRETRGGVLIVVMVSDQPTLHWVVDANKQSHVSFRCVDGALPALKFKAASAPVDPIVSAPATPIDVDAIGAKDLRREPPVLQKIFALLRTSAENQNAVLKRAEESVESTKALIEGAVSKIGGQVQEQKDDIQKLQAQHETNSDEICQLKEEVFSMKRQLADGGVHYHDNRVVVVIGQMPLDVAQLPAPIELNWYNKHNTGNKTTRVFLPAQTPKQDANGKILLDLLQWKGEAEPSITGIWPCHLSLPSKKRRKWH